MTVAPRRVPLGRPLSDSMSSSCFDRPAPARLSAVSWEERREGWRARGVADGYDRVRFSGPLDRLKHRNDARRVLGLLARVGPAPLSILDVPVGTGRMGGDLEGAGHRVTGVRYRSRNGTMTTVRARRETILSGGAVGTPHILMLSGIGPADHLRAHGIEVVKDLSGVGQNLNDHPDFVLKFRCLQPVSLWPGTRPVARVRAGLQWLLTGTGICGSNHFDVVACIRSNQGVAYPDLQLTVSPIAVDHETWAPLPEHAFQVHVGLMRAHSRGEIRLRSGDPAVPPTILGNYLSDPRDRDVMRTGIRHAKDVVSQPAFAGLAGTEIFPGIEANADAALDHALNTHLASQWHLSGTARMGQATDRGAVVDPDGKVHGVGGLRVVDASIMPIVTNGNTNAPTIMIAEKAADLIKAAHQEEGAYIHAG